jgi:hypothetical protein
LICGQGRPLLSLLKLKKRNTYTVAHKQWLCATKQANPVLTHKELIKQFNTKFGNDMFLSPSTLQSH